jgi:hypothetical protein
MRFCWVTDVGSYIIYARDEDEAVRIALASKMSGGQTLEEAVGWFKKDDRLYDIVDDLVVKPIKSTKKLNDLFLRNER